LTFTWDAAIGAAVACKVAIRCKPPDALCAAAAKLGAHVIALVVVLNKQLGLSFSKIVTLLQQQYSLTVTRTGLVHAVHRAARHARPTYETGR